MGRRAWLWTIVQHSHVQRTALAQMSAVDMHAPATVDMGECIAQWPLTLAHRSHACTAYAAPSTSPPTLVRAMPGGLEASVPWMLMSVCQLHVLTEEAVWNRRGQILSRSVRLCALVSLASVVAGALLT